MGLQRYKSSDDWGTLPWAISGRGSQAVRAQSQIAARWIRITQLPTRAGRDQTLHYPGDRSALPIFMLIRLRPGESHLLIQAVATGPQSMPAAATPVRGKSRGRSVAAW
jgi:hypothetical protein